MTIFDKLNIQYVLTVPDSLGCRLISYISRKSKCQVILCATEIEALTICSGLNLSGVLSIILIENSGIRCIGDALTRFELGHGIHNIFLLSERGGLGEPNWWGSKHTCVTDSVLKELYIITAEVNSTSEFPCAIKEAITTFRSEQVSVAIRLKKTFWEELMLHDI